MVINRYFMSFFHFPWPINYNHGYRCTKFSTHSSSSWFWSKIFSFLWIHGVAHDHVLRASNRINEWRTASKIIPKFDVDITFLWWKPKPREVRLCFELEPFRVWYYHISLNSRTLVILLQINPAFGDEPKIVNEGFYEIKYTFIFAWF